MAHISGQWDLHITQAFNAPSANLELCKFNLRRTVGGHSRSRSCVMLSIIITLEIVNWYGTVIAQSGRHFYENRGRFLESCVV